MRNHVPYHLTMLGGSFKARDHRNPSNMFSLAHGDDNDQAASAAFLAAASHYAAESDNKESRGLGHAQYSGDAGYRQPAGTV